MQFSGKIIPVLADIRDFSRWSVAFMQEFKEVITIWQKSLADDNKISQIEAQDIERELNDVLGALVFFYVSLENDKYGSDLQMNHFLLNATSQSWRLSVTKLPKNIQLVDFLKWYQALLDTKVRALFSEYLEAMADHVVSNEEKQSLQASLGLIIKEVVYVIVSIRNLNLNS